MLYIIPGHKFENVLNKVETTLLEQAINSTTEGVIITDARRPDNPVVYVNKGFQNLTGYDLKDILGRNCKFLQGKGTNPKSLDQINKAITQQNGCVVELLNYRKDGSEFWNRLSITPLLDENGEITHFVGVQSDITELRRAQSELIAANQKLETFFSNTIREMEQARLTQSILMPAELPQSDFVRFAVRFEPLEQIGGDFFDIVELGGHLYGILLADATGHGIPAAMLTFMTSNTFKSQYRGELSPSKVITRINEILYRQMPDGMFVSLYYMIYNAKTHTLTYCQAGIPPALLISPRNDKVEILKTRGTLVGIIPPDLARYEDKQVQLRPDDKLLLFTDAILEANNHNGDLVDMQTLQKYLTGSMDMSIEELIRLVHLYGLGYAGHSSYLDDATLVGFQVLS